MEEPNFVLLWKEQYDKIDQSLKINQQLLKETIHRKARSAIRPLKIIRRIGIVAGILWCAAVAYVLLMSWDISNIFFKISLFINFVVTAIAVGLYIYHLHLIAGFDNSQSVLDAQMKLSKLKASNLKTLGILWLQLPVYSTWFITMEWIINSPLSFWLIQVPIVLIQLYMGIWLFRNLNFKNHQKKWFKWFVSKGEFATIKRANNLMAEIDDFKK